MTRKTENSISSSQFLKTDGGETKSNSIEVPSISLPKGGGAIKGIDEKFSVNATNGTASFSIPLPFSPARGASPELSLTYSSGAGNGVFGLGWGLNLPSIKRKTDKKLPQYLDSEDSDFFLFSEAEDLVPEFLKEPDGSFAKDVDGNYIIKETSSADDLFAIRFYKPRIEGLFARIEKWNHKTNNVIKWRVITRDNITTLFGWSSNSIIVDPQDSRKIFQWFPEFVFDDKGNCAHYIYKKEDDVGIDAEQLHNKNRVENGVVRYTNLYLEKILYGNKTPYQSLDATYPEASDYLFQTIFDYGEYQTIAPYTKVKEWDFRVDAFSNYKSGFEIRTTRLCKRVLLFHHFTELTGGSALVKSLNFDYDTVREQDFTFLKSIRSFGYIKKQDGSYTHKSLPATEFEYQHHEWNDEVKTIESDSLVHAPIGLDESQYHFTDLYNEGLSGILTEQTGGWFYKYNLGNGRFEPAKLVSPKPSFVGMGSQLQLMDLDADGRKQLVNFSDEPKGYFELNDEDEWQSFRTFEQLPNIDLGDANTRIFDLNGDGKPDVLMTEEQIFTWYESKGKEGFKPEKRTTKAADEEAGPHIVFADPSQSVFLADMSGDGMTDIVRIRNGEVCYWPNLGYGKFGAKIGMDNAPLFDYQGAFNPAYIKLTDIDGSGTTDIIYLGKNKFSCWKNLSGNRFSVNPFEIEHFPEIHNQSRVSVVDLLGNGVACIVWSCPLGKNNASSLKYIDLMNSKKPHIMVSYKNNLGKEVSLEYTPSTQFYIRDKQAGKPWITKLHFPVHCLSKTETRDIISGYRFVSSYIYHHGYYDHAEREFRGFGMVEQIDAESFDHWVKDDASNIVDRSLHQEPVVTKSWYHTGAFINHKKILNQFEYEYWYEEMSKQGFDVINREISLPDGRLITAPGIETILVEHLSVQEWQEAYRACKGMQLRSEVFAKDAPLEGATPDERQKELTPYNVATHNCVIELIQPKGQNQHAIYIVKESESITYNYERKTEDPRIAHTLNIKLDEYGNVLESASVVYPRLKTDSSLPIEVQEAQNQTLISYTHNRFTNDINIYESYRLKLASETKTYQLKGVEKASTLFSVNEFENILTNSNEVDYYQIDEQVLVGSAQKRLIEHVRTSYLSNSLTAPLPLHRIESLALPFESYQLAYTSTLLNEIFGSKVSDALMLEGKFTHVGGDGSWWIRSGTAEYIDATESLNNAKSRFYLPIAYLDPYGAKTQLGYYRDYYLFVDETEDALGNTEKVETFDFRTLAPQEMRDPNGNLSQVMVDELGFVKAFAVLGKGNEADDLNGLNEFTSDAEDTLVNEFFNAPKSDVLVTKAKDLLQHVTVRFVYDFDVYKNSGKPVVVSSIAREQHFQSNNDSPVQISLEYSNGLGQVVMKKAQAEPGKAKQVVVNADDSYTVTEIDTKVLNPQQLRWIGSGRTVLNNKGNAVKQYEPYFSTSHQYEDLTELVETGVTPVIYYDAPGRLIKTELPNGTLSRTEFDAWKQVAYDPNDTISESSWYDKRTNRLMDAELIAAGKDPIKEKSAADQAAQHANTPTTQHFDTQGRPVLSVEHNRNSVTQADEFYLTFVVLDIEGNLRKVVDARGNTVMQYQYDMLGNKVYQKSMDAGQRWLLMNIIDNPLRTWDERNHEFQYIYDALHRLTSSKVIGGDGETPLNHIFDRLFYGEAEPDPEQKNIRGQVVKHYDTGGAIRTPTYDFKGQPILTSRQLFKDYKGIVNWIDANLIHDLETESFTFVTITDSLGRITQQTAPDGSIIIPEYNQAGLLNSESVKHPNHGGVSSYIKNIDYNEKGQRNQVVYGNDVITNFIYDKETFRLNHLESKRQNSDPLQDLRYTYDPIGNITHIEDKNIPTVFFNNQKITGISTYIYDALYRLIEATGRESNTPLSFDSKDNWNDTAFLKQLNPGDPMAMRNYTQKYLYDSVGNIQQMRHQAASNAWARNYQYQVENNRLVTTQIGTNIYSYPHHTKHGFMTTMPHLEAMEWNFKEELVRTIRQKRTDGGTAETTYYQYDGKGQRVRKITENQATVGNVPTKKNERIYTAEYELYKIHSGTDAGLERTSLSLMDEQHRFVMIDTETKTDMTFGIPVGRTDPEQTVRYQLHNHLGSAYLELDDSAQVISYEEYHPYGTTAYQAKNSTIKSAGKRYRYTGMERDEESGLSYHSARYYLPWLGRWLMPDPAHNLTLTSKAPSVIDPKSEFGDEEEGDSDTSSEQTRPLEVNLYVYVINNPLVYFDLDGLAPKSIGRIYHIEGTVGGKPVQYTGSTIQPLRKRFSKHQWSKLIRAKSTKISVYQVKADIKPGLSSRGTVRSAMNEAIRSVEQRVIDRKKSTMARTLNKVRAALPENIQKWAIRHKVTLERPKVVKQPGSGIKLRAAGGLLVLLDVAMMARQEKVSKYVMAPYVLNDEYGDFTISERRGPLNGLWGNKYYENYISGSLTGDKFEITEEKFEMHRREAKALHGYLDVWGDFVPGILNRELKVSHYNPNEA